MPDGKFRWFYPYVNVIASHASPAIGADGKIYAGGQGTDLCAYLTDASRPWCIDLPGYGPDRTPAIASDGTIYYPTDDGYLNAVNPDGTLQWSFQVEEVNNFGIPDGIAIASDDLVYFGLRIDGGEHYLYKVDSDGEFLWKVGFPANDLTGVDPFIRSPISIDRAGNAFICPENSHCYGIGPDGNVMWEFEFPLIDSIIVTAGVQPVIASDGLFFILDYQSRLYAFADPALYPVLETPVVDIRYDLEPGMANFTTTLPLSSTGSPISFTVSIDSEGGWLSATQPISSTPALITLLFETENLATGVYTAQLEIKPAAQVSPWLEIPVKLVVSSQQVFLPGVMEDSSNSYRILFGSSWFEEAQLASIEQDGKNRTVITRDLAGQIERSSYSPDGRKLALVEWVNNTYQINVIDTASGATILEIKDQSFNSSPAWSPESDRLAFISGRDEPSTGEVYAINLDGTGLTRLTHNQTDELGSAWSPDGEKIAVKVSYNRTYLMDADGADFHVLSTGNWTDLPESWSPDGRYLLLYSQESSQADTELGIYDLHTASYTPLTDHFYARAAWSPDGNWVAYAGWDVQYDWDIFVIHPDGSGKKNLTHALSNEDNQPVWSPDSRWIAFTSRNDDIYNDPNFDIYVVRSDGSRLKQLTTNILLDADPFWQPQR